MDTIGAYEAKTHLPRLLERVSRGESLLITRHGQPIARLVPVPDARTEKANQAAARIRKRREQLHRVPLADLLETTHEGHRY